MFKRIRVALISLMLCAITSSAMTKQSMPMITLYDAPNATKVVATVPLNTAMVPIIYKQGWAKVGLRSDGQVGWVNIKQYETARDAYFKPNIQTWYVSTTQDKQSGKPTTTIVAYHNGKKLSDQQARVVYETMLKQQQAAQRAEAAYWSQFNNMMRIQEQQMDQMFNADPFVSSNPAIILMPGPVMIPSRHHMMADGRGALPPAYLSVAHWQQCAVTETRGTYKAWCLPRKQPKSCPDVSWKKLANKAGASWLPVCAN